jgi:flavorubredoxin
MKSNITSFIFTLCLLSFAQPLKAQIGLQKSPVTYEKPVDSALVQISKLEPQQVMLQSKGKLFKSNYGFQIEEFEKVFPFLVSTRVEIAKADNFGKSERTKKYVIKTIDYTSLVPVLIAAMQEQQEMILKQQQQIDALQKLIHTK